jgi:hypothetical protein
MVWKGDALQMRNNAANGLFCGEERRRDFRTQQPSGRARSRKGFAFRKAVLE